MQSNEVQSKSTGVPNDRGTTLYIIFVVTVARGLALSIPMVFFMGVEWFYADTGVSGQFMADAQKGAGG